MVHVNEGDGNPPSGVGTRVIGPAIARDQIPHYLLQREWNTGPGLRLYPRDLASLLKGCALKSVPTHRESLENIIAETLDPQLVDNKASPTELGEMQKIKDALFAWLYKDEAPPLTSDAAAFASALWRKGYHLIAVDLRIVTPDGRYGLTLDFVVINKHSNRLLAMDFTSLRTGETFAFTTNPVEAPVSPAVRHQEQASAHSIARRLLVINHCASVWFRKVVHPLLVPTATVQSLDWDVHSDPWVALWKRNVAHQADVRLNGTFGTVLTICQTRLFSAVEAGGSREVAARKHYAKCCVRPMLKRWCLGRLVAKHLMLCARKIHARNNLLRCEHLADAEADGSIEALTPAKKFDLAMKASADFDKAAGDFFRDKLADDAIKQQLVDQCLVDVQKSKLGKRKRASERGRRSVEPRCYGFRMAWGPQPPEPPHLSQQPPSGRAARRSAPGPASAPIELSDDENGN